MPPMTLTQFIAGLSTALSPLAKAPEPPTATAPGTTPEAAGGGDVSKVLTEASKALAELAGKVGADGKLPAGGEETCKAIATALGQLCATGAPQETVSPASNLPNMDEAALPVAARHPEAKRIVKFELDAYTAMVATTRAVQDRLWKVSDLMAQQKVPEALTELKGATDMLTNVANQMGGAGAGAAAPAEKMVKVSFTPATLMKWLNEQIAAAATEKPEDALKRLGAVQKVVDVAKASNFEAPASTPITAEVEERYVGSSGGEGTKMDLTVTSEQKTEEKKPTEAPPPDASAFAQNALEIMGKTVASLVSAHNATQAPGSTAFSKRLMDKGGFLWPRDMAREDLYDDEKNAPKPEPQDERW